MKKVLLGLVLVLGTIMVNAQHKSLDSLKKIHYTTYDSLTADWYLKKYQRGIEKSYDEFENETTFRTESLTDISITKVISKGKNYYYLSLNAIGSTLNYGLRGVSLMFKDKTKFIKPNEKIDVRYSEYKRDWVYSVFISLTPAEVKLFQTKLVDKFKLYIYDSSLSNDIAFNFLMQSNYITTLK